MNNPFNNVDTKVSEIPLQKSQGGVIKKKGAGRPRRPNMACYLIRMDKSLHAQLSRYATDMGLNKSAVISQAVRTYINSSSI